MIRALCILCLLLSTACAESPQELLASTGNLSLHEAAFLLAMHGYDVSYVGGVFWLNETEMIAGSEKQ